MRKRILLILIFSLIFTAFNFAFSQEELEIHFFYSQTCPHCLAEQKFLDEIEQKYPQVKISRYLASAPKNQEILIELAKKHKAERYIGLVPLTFVGEDFFVGFDTPEGIGKRIEDSIARQVGKIEKPPPAEEKKKITLPFIGELDIERYSLPALAVIFGFFDGFDICSLSALVLVLGIVLAFRSRFKVLFFGGVFILINAFTYGLLIMLWFKIFSFLSSFIKGMEILIGILAVLGGIYFLKRFLKIGKTGPVCEVEKGWGNGIISKYSQKIRELFKTEKVFPIILGLLLFDLVISAIEFPCSGALPVLFAGILSEAGISSFQYFLYLAIFLFFYLLDEIVVFGIAVSTMKIWISSPKFVTFANLAVAIILFLLGAYYFLLL